MARKVFPALVVVFVFVLLAASPGMAGQLDASENACGGDCAAIRAAIRAAIAVGNRPDPGGVVALGRGYSPNDQKCVDGGSGCVAA